jgi:hypothetical protein
MKQRRNKCLFLAKKLSKKDEDNFRQEYREDGRAVTLWVTVQNAEYP